MDANLISQIEHLVQKGDTHKARALLQALNLKTVERSTAVGLAHLSRRTGLYLLSLKILKPIIFHQDKFSSTANEAEKTCYAMTLSLMGAKRLAEQLFSHIDFKSHPEAVMRYAFHLMTVWNYSKASAYLEQYLKIANSSDYQSLVARLNHLACLVNAGRTEEARHAIANYQKNLNTEEHRLLMGNSYELLGQVHFHLGDYKSAQENLDIAENILAQYSGRYLFYVKKWQRLIELYKSPKDPLVVSSVLALQKEARQGLDWETVRDCDFHLALVCRDLSRLSRVYFGTPHESFRQRVRSSRLYSKLHTKNYDWNAPNDKSGRVFDLGTGDIDGGLSLPPGGLAHKLLSILLRDLYRPTSLGEIFESIYRGEHFDPYHSPNRVHQALFQLKKAFREQGMNITIRSHDTGFKLLIPKTFAIRVRRKTPNLSPERVMFRRFKKCWSRSSFVTANVEDSLGISRTWAKKIICFALAAKLVAPRGIGKSRRYQILR